MGEWLKKRWEWPWCVVRMERSCRMGLRRVVGMRAAKQARASVFLWAWGKATGGWEEGIMWLCLKTMNFICFGKMDCCRRLTGGKSGKTRYSREHQRGPEMTAAGTRVVMMSLVRSGLPFGRWANGMWRGSDGSRFAGASEGRQKSKWLLILVRTTRWMVVLTETGRTRRGAGQEGNPALCFEHVTMRSLSGLHREMWKGRWTDGPGVQEKGWSWK